MARLLSKPKAPYTIAETTAQKINQITNTNPLTKIASIELKGVQCATLE